jgi:hypothetical protein
LKLVCDGQVLRVDQKDGVHGIAAKFADSFFSNPAEIVDADAGWLTRTH